MVSILRKMSLTCMAEFLLWFSVSGLVRMRRYALSFGGGIPVGVRGRDAGKIRLTTRSVNGEVVTCHY